MLYIKNLTVSTEEKIILNKLNLKINPGEIHAIMGPNGSGKSTLAMTIAGQKNYKISVDSKIYFKNKNIQKLKPEERAGEGIFVAFQYPIEIPGISNQLFLQTAINSIRKYCGKKELNIIETQTYIQKKLDMFHISSDFLTRLVNVGFSGGEKKRNDILQMAVLKPSLCILDETDSGLDIDALKIVSDGINKLRTKKRSFIIITHYQRILNYIKPDFVHILYKGTIIQNGDFNLAKQLEKKGYEWISKKR